MAALAVARHSSHRNILAGRAVRSKQRWRLARFIKSKCNRLLQGMTTIIQMKHPPITMRIKMPSENKQQPYRGHLRKDVNRKLSTRSVLYDQSAMIYRVMIFNKTLFGGKIVQKWFLIRRKIIMQFLLSSLPHSFSSLDFNLDSIAITYAFYAKYSGQYWKSTGKAVVHRRHKPCWLNVLAALWETKTDT